MGVQEQMAAFRGAASIDELRQRFLDDEGVDDAQYRARWGADKPRFLTTDELTMRPNARHLLAPLWRDADGREYTPDTVDNGSADVWWVRIPPGLTRRLRAAGAIELTQFPQPGEELVWSRITYGTVPRDAVDTIRVVVSELIAPKTASAQLVLEAPAPAARTDAEQRRLAARESAREAARLRHQD
jgi:hypothetical protein